MNQTNLLGDFDIILRCMTSILVLFCLTRLLGKKQISQLSFFDYIIGISIGSIASQFAVDESIPYLHGVIALFVYTLFPVLVSKVSLKYVKLRKILEDTPTLLIQKGKFIGTNLKKSRFTLNDLVEEARLQGIFKVSDIDYAILETSGQVSFLLKPEKQGVIREDLNLKSKYSGLEAELIIDGTIMHKHLKLINKDEIWLENELQRLHVTSIKDVFFASVNEEMKWNIFLK
ncbi:MAG: DUF421 domain-containing protein [Turicibacter sp.]